MKSRKTILIVGLFAIVFGSLLMSTVSQSMAAKKAKKGNPNPGILPVHANAFGTTYGELAIEWWIWAYGAPSGQSPIEDETGEDGYFGQEGKVWFLAGTTGDPEADPTTRYVTVPAGKALFFPIMNMCWVTYADEPGPGEEGYTDEDEARFIMNWIMGMAYDLSCTIDGAEVQDVAEYRAESPTIDFPILEGTVGQDVTGWEESGLYSFGMADGYWLLLAPLSEGEHVIQFSGSHAWGWSVDVTYFITVVDDDND